MLWDLFLTIIYHPNLSKNQNFLLDKSNGRIREEALKYKAFGHKKLGAAAILHLQQPLFLGLRIQFSYRQRPLRLQLPNILAILIVNEPQMQKYVPAHYRT